MHKTMRWSLAAAVLTAGVASGEITLPAMFGDRAVLQRGETVPVWGWAEAGETVTVSFGGQEKSAEADEDGGWKVALDALAADATGRDLKVTGSVSEAVTAADVLVGEVWMASGQSNMQWALTNTDGAAEEIAQATIPGLRMFLTDLETAAVPQGKVGGQWWDTTPETAGPFSAVGYYFGKKLHTELWVPVGIIRTAWGGKPSEAFTSRETLSAQPEGRALVDRLDAAVAAYEPARAKADFAKKLAAWEAQAAKIKQMNRLLPEGSRKALPRKPAADTNPALSPNSPAAIYNAMIHPWAGYAMKGAIWYQGESNAGRAKEYETIFPLLILDWRKQWKCELPFYFVQLANFRAPTTEPGVPDSWAELQNAQFLTLSLPKTGMAVINDIGEEGDIHPRNKRDVGNRLARWALARDYGKEVVVSGPLYAGCAVEGGKLRVKFEHAKGLQSRDGGPLKRFEIAGADQTWFWGDAVIDGEDVVVSNAAVPVPVAVRYAWASNPSGANLVNGEGLPASLFRTDDWKLSTEK